MAMGKIKDGNPSEGEAVTSVTSEVPSEADASSAPGPYDDLEVNRPPVSTNRPDVPIAASLIEGAGAPTPEPEYRPDGPVEPGEGPANLYVSKDDKVVASPLDKQSDKPAKADDK